MPMARTDPECVVEVRSEPSGTALVVRGCLDATAGRALVTAAGTVVAGGANRLDIDLCSITAFTDEGACALAECRELCDGVPDGLHYRTRQGAGREALLAAYAER